MVIWNYINHPFSYLGWKNVPSAFWLIGAPACTKTWAKSNISVFWLLSRPLQVHRCHTRLPSEALSARDILLPIKQRFYQYWRVTFNYWITIELCCTKLYNFVKQSGFLKSTSWHKFNKILNVGLYLLYVPSIQDSTVKIKHSSATLCQHFGQWIVNWNKSMLYRALNKSILMYAMWTRLKWSQSTDF